VNYGKTREGNRSLLFCFLPFSENKLFAFPTLSERDWRSPLRFGARQIKVYIVNLDFLTFAVATMGKLNRKETSGGAKTGIYLMKPDVKWEKASSPP